jgi:hypothetical protein
VCVFLFLGWTMLLLEFHFKQYCALRQVRAAACVEGPGIEKSLARKQSYASAASVAGAAQGRPVQYPLTLLPARCGRLFL